ncbi:hypothetical protein Agub_g13614 [Astrephomene gubernaculifera]|uniref:phytol kinase n=1 Tax=Astrephomene gubernaculifera TaxID=47775 RepID=A0AAD3E081_9CHLO|nr:hypothetical protein Agub_g13614 [Astrephomene gubernaculifera]
MARRQLQRNSSRDHASARGERGPGETDCLPAHVRACLRRLPAAVERLFSLQAGQQLPPAPTARFKELDKFIFQNLHPVLELLSNLSTSNGARSAAAVAVLADKAVRLAMLQLIGAGVRLSSTDLHPDPDIPAKWPPTSFIGALDLLFKMLRALSVDNSITQPPPHIVDFARRLVRMQTLQALSRSLASATALLPAANRPTTSASSPPLQQPAQQRQRRNQGKTGTDGTQVTSYITQAAGACLAAELLHGLVQLAIKAFNSIRGQPPEHLPEALYFNELVSALRDSYVMEHGARLMLLAGEAELPHGLPKTSPKLGEGVKLFLEMINDLARIWRVLMERGGPFWAPTTAQLCEVLTQHGLQHAAVVHGLAALCEADGGASYGIAPEVLHRLHFSTSEYSSSNGYRHITCTIGGGGDEVKVHNRRPLQLVDVWALQALPRLLDPSLRVSVPGARAALAIMWRMVDWAVASGRVWQAQAALRAKALDMLLAGGGVGVKAGEDDGVLQGEAEEGGGAPQKVMPQDLVAVAAVHALRCARRLLRGPPSVAAAAAVAVACRTLAATAGAAAVAVAAADEGASGALVAGASAVGASASGAAAAGPSAAGAAAAAAATEAAVARWTEQAVRWWRLAVAVADHVICCADTDQMEQVTEVLRESFLEGTSLPWGDTEKKLLPAPPPEVATALAGGFLPCLERLLRRAGEDVCGLEAAAVRGLLSPSSRHCLASLLTYGEEKQAAALVVTLGKLLGCCDPTAITAPDVNIMAPHHTCRTYAKAALDFLSFSREALVAAAPVAAAAAGTSSNDASSSAAPYRQLQLLASCAACEWLPVLSRLVREGMDHLVHFAHSEATEDMYDYPEYEKVGMAAEVLLAHLLPWLLALTLKCLEHDDADGAESSWRQLLLEEVDVVQLLGAALQCGISEAMPPQQFVASCCAVAVIAPEQVRQAAVAADASGDGSWRPTAVYDLLAGLTICLDSGSGEEDGSEGDGGGTDLERAADALAAQLETWIENSQDGLSCRGSSSSMEVLRDAARAVVSPEDEELAAALLVSPGELRVRGLLRGCGNPGCTNLAGDSEADVKLKKCGRCGQVGYCCRECQVAHWKAGHKEACGRGATRG